MSRYTFRILIFIAIIKDIHRHILIILREEEVFLNFYIDYKKKISKILINILLFKPLFSSFLKAAFET